jgi:hypothetical protein
MNSNIKRRLRSIWPIVVFGVLLIIILPFIYLYVGEVKSVNIYQQEYTELTVESQPVKDAMQVLADLGNEHVESKMHPAFQNLLTASQEFEPKITAQRNSVQQQVDQSTSVIDNQNGTQYLKIIDIRERLNQKISEFATFGLSVNWGKPTQAQVNQLIELSNEIGDISKELNSTQL